MQGGFGVVGRAVRAAIRKHQLGVEAHRVTSEIPAPGTVATVIPAEPKTITRQFSCISPGGLIHCPSSAHSTTLSTLHSLHSPLSPRLVHSILMHSENQQLRLCNATYNNKSYDIDVGTATSGHEVEHSTRPCRGRARRRSRWQGTVCGGAGPPVRRGPCRARWPRR